MDKNKKALAIILSSIAIISVMFFMYKNNKAEQFIEESAKSKFRYFISLHESIYKITDNIVENKNISKTNYTGLCRDIANLNMVYEDFTQYYSKYYNKKEIMDYYLNYLSFINDFYDKLINYDSSKNASFDYFVTIKDKLYSINNLGNKIKKYSSSVILKYLQDVDEILK